MRTTPAHDNVFDFNSLLHPGTVFAHPRDVVAHPELSLAEKRAILASWASDASAIASCPALRAPDGLKAPVHIDEILEALCALDDNGPRTRRVASPCACVQPSGARRPEQGLATMEMTRESRCGTGRRQPSAVN